MATGSRIGSLYVRIGANTDDLKRGVSGATKTLESLGPAANRAIGNIAGLTTAAVALKAAFNAVSFGTFIRETAQAEKEQAQLAAVLKSTGEAAGYSRDKLNSMAEAMSLTSTLSVGEINQAQTSLLAFTGIAGEEFPRALQAAIDMSARTGMSVVSAAETIGRALDVPSKGLAALSRQGFRFTDDQKKIAEHLEATGRTAEAQAIVLGELESSYGGAARAARDTFAGSITGLRNQLNLLMTGQDGSLDGATQAVNNLSATLTSPETKAAFAEFVSMIATATSAFATFMSDINDGSFWGWVQSSGADVKNAAAEVGNLEKSLDGMRSSLKAFQDVGEDSSFMRWWNADDVAILETQISATESKLEYLRKVAERSRDAANKAINDSVAASGYAGDEPPSFAPNNTPPKITIPDKGDGGKAAKKLAAENATKLAALVQYTSDAASIQFQADQKRLEDLDTVHSAGLVSEQQYRDMLISISDKHFEAMSGLQDTFSQDQIKRLEEMHAAGFITDQDYYAQQLEQLQALEDAKTQIAMDAYEARKEALGELTLDDDDAKAEYDQALLDSEQQLQDELNSIHAQGVATRNTIAQNESRQRQQVMDGMMSNLASLMDSGNKEMFQIGKIAAVSQALVKGYQAVVNSYEAGTEIGGPVVGAAFAATAAAATAAQIASLSSVQFGGGGRPSAGGGGGGYSKPSDAMAAGPVNPSSSSAEKKAVTINLTGEIFNRQQVRDLIEQINEATADGAVLRLN